MKSNSTIYVTIINTELKADTELLYLGSVLSNVMEAERLRQKQVKNRRTGSVPQRGASCLWVRVGHRGSNSQGETGGEGADPKALRGCKTKNNTIMPQKLLSFCLCFTLSLVCPELVVLGRGMILLTRGHLVTSRDIFSCHNLGGGHGPGI